MPSRASTSSKTYDSEATRKRIFEAAVAEFSQYGIAGARVDRIAAQAKSNKQLIYSYFGNKEALFAAVLQEKLEQLAAAINLEPDRVPEYVGELFDFHAANPETLRLVMWEGLHYGDQPVPNELARTEHYLHKAATIAEGQRQGFIDDALQARHIAFMLLALTGWWFAVPPIARMLLGGDADSKAVMAEYRAQIVEAARRIVQNKPAQKQ
ncbi:MAG: TetR family transcriptional regulator [Leptolyngbya sp. BL-A-14]